MKKTVIIIIALIGLVSCRNSNEFEIIASSDGLEEGKQILVRKLGDDNRFMVLDTLTVAKGGFTYKGITEIPEMRYFFIENRSVPVIIEPGKITVTIYKDSLNASVVKGTPSNEDINTLKEGLRKIGDKNAAIRKKAFEASQKKDSATVLKLREEYTMLQEESATFQKNFVTENPQSYVSAIILKQLLLTNAKGITVEEIQNLYNTLTENIKATKEAKEVSTQLYQIGKTAVGAIAPDFSAPTPEGEALSLKDVKGKVTLIDFWAAWCKPCRAENPNIVALYDKYHEKGLNIIGVSLDRTAEEWKKAIEDDQLTWQQVSHIKYWQDPIAKAYNVRAIPANFILDTEGKIVAKDLRGEALEAKIKSLLQL